MNFNDTPLTDIANYTNYRARLLIQRRTNSGLTAECELCGKRNYKKKMIMKDIYKEKIYYCRTCSFYG